MAHERRRAALAALCVFAVALAAALFPAGGFGTYPSGVGTGGGPDAPADGGAASDPPTDSPDSNTPTETTVEETTDETTDSTTAETTTTETTTEEETTTATSSNTDGGGPDLSGVFAVLTGLATAVVALGFWSGVLGLAETSTGGLPFTVTVGGRPVGSLVGTIPSRTMGFVVGLSASVPRLLDDAASLAREVGGGLSTVTGAQGLGTTFAAIPRAFAGLGAGASLLSGIGGSVSLPSFGGRGRESGSGGSAPTPDSEPEETGPPSVEDAWQAMSERVRVRNRKARTPEEVARAAIDRGYPDDAVRRLTDAFREVRYGGLSRSNRTPVARSALDRLRRFWEGDE
ncbi:DUF4129 domain-containing protein [Halorussus amylolyticus]|uniref:DUF4129 domain-containing protein n=1 Tax=Halorussus amylolyticus TaxID=1126242 RepID=UPI00104DEBD9|nr:DUF4129 domain-containing protein [Halorussus amylolyticus]